MNGIIIAAGRGSRMDPVAKRIPKCLLPVAGRPLIEHTIDRLRPAAMMIPVMSLAALEVPARPDHSAAWFGRFRASSAMVSAPLMPLEPRL